MAIFEVYEKEGVDFFPLKREGIDLLPLNIRKKAYVDTMVDVLRTRLGLRPEDEVKIHVAWVD